MTDNKRIQIPQAKRIRGILLQPLVLDCVKYQEKEAVIVIPRGVEIEVSRPFKGYSESSPKDLYEVNCILNDLKLDGPTSVGPDKEEA